jgi:hypothetical protein
MSTLATECTRWYDYDRCVYWCRCNMCVMHFWRLFRDDSLIFMRPVCCAVWWVSNICWLHHQQSPWRSLFFRLQYIYELSTCWVSILKEFVNAWRLFRIIYSPDHMRLAFACSLNLCDYQFFLHWNTTYAILVEPFQREVEPGPD